MGYKRLTSQQNEKIPSRMERVEINGRAQLIPLKGHKQPTLENLPCSYEDCDANMNLLI